MTYAVKVADGGEWMLCESSGQYALGGVTYWGRVLLRMEPETLAEKGLELAQAEGAPPVPGLGQPPVLDDLEGVPTWTWSPGGIANLRACRVGEIKAEAGRRILTAFPTWKQANMNMRATELVDLRVDGELTEDEETERQALIAAAAWIKSIRTASDAIEDALPEDAEGLSAFVAATAEGWPV